MSLKCGIVGLSMTGKTTIFNCISNTKAQVSAAAFSAAKANLGVVNVPDTRLKELEQFQPTEQLVPATVEIVDIPGLTKSTGTGDSQANRFLADIRQTDAIIHVLRCFDSVSIPHIEGSVDPLRDKEIVDFELQIRDLESVEKKLIKVERAAKTGDKDAKVMAVVLERCKEQLESFKPIREMEFSKDDHKAIDDLFLLTIKPVMYVCNVDDKSAVTGNAYVEKVREAIVRENAEMLVIAGALESEIAELEDESDRQSFLAEAGLAEPGVHKLVRAAYSFLNLQTFFTVGPKEIRAWTIHQGMTAPQAAGVIHSDLERGFIRAEVMKYNDFIKYGTEAKCKEAGKFFVEGKNYVVGDGDILHIRFNV